jgi:hypothetical protein
VIIIAFTSINFNIISYNFLLKNTSTPKIITTVKIYVIVVSCLKKEVKKNIIEIKLNVKTNRDLYCKNPLKTNSSINGIRNIKGKIFDKLNFIKSLSSIKDS